MSASSWAKDASTTLRVFAHWLPDVTARNEVARLDDAPAPAPPAQPVAVNAFEGKLLGLAESVVTLTWASWNQMVSWLQRIDGLRSVA